MSKITQKQYKQEFIEIKKYFDLDFFGTIDNKNSIYTKWGLYKFYFDKNGKPVFQKQERNEEEISYVREMQKACMEFSNRT